MAVITTGSHPKALWPGVHAWFGAKYSEHPSQYTRLFDIKSSSKNYEELVEQTGFGLAPVKGEGSSTAYDSHAQGVTSRGTNKAYSLGFIVTREEKADNLYSEVSMQRAQSLAFSMAQTRENVGANVYNRAFTAAYAGGDGKELCATDHGSLAGNQSNELATAADLSEASLEDLTIDILDAKNSKGLKISLQPKCLIVPTALIYDAQRILKSTLQSGTANNDTNALKSLSVIPDVKVNNYLTDSDAWFIRTNAPSSMCWFDREGVQFTKDEDFDTDNAKAKAYMRFVAFWGDWRGVYGSPGA
jgi:phage major head subunit gpT-like protein